MSNTEQPTMILLTGPNGAGKTTFRQKFLEPNPIFENIDSLNWDEETIKLAQQNSQLPVRTAYIKAGKVIVQKTQKCFDDKKSFIYETTAADHRHVNLIETAKNLEYKIVTVFIGLASPELSKLRVKHRVANGGHDVPVHNIETRYPKIMTNFSYLFDQSDTCFVIDNSGKKYELILLKSNDLSITFRRFPKYLPQDKFDLTKEIQPDGSILLSNNEYNKKKPEEKQQLIQHLIELLSVKNI